MESLLAPNNERKEIDPLNLEKLVLKETTKAKMHYNPP